MKEQEEELDKILQKKTSDLREVQVVEAMEDICQAKYFSTYDYSPPTTVKACRFLIEHYEEDIEAMLIRKEKETEHNVCYELTKACEGVDRTKKEKEKTDVRFNDQPQKVERGVPQKDDDGIERINVDINDPSSAASLAEQIKKQVGMDQFGGQYFQGDEDEDDEEEEEEDGDDDEQMDDVDDAKSEAKTEL